jgi:PIN domain nuclease of toxin-antitoxin system
MRHVLDASALLAYLFGEPGDDVVADAISRGANASTVNVAEVLSVVASRGGDPADVAARLTRAGVLGEAIAVEPFTLADAAEAARLRPLTRDHGLSLADRACIALARRLGLPALTADRTWADAHIDAELVFIR